MSNRKGRWALKNSEKMLKALENAKRNGLIDKKQADRLIEDLKNSMEMAKNEINAADKDKKK